DWYDRLTTFVPRAWLGKAAAITNVLVFAWLVARGVDATNPDSHDLVRFGANEWSLTLDGEPWRLLTAAFLHAGWVHLGFNAWGLWQMGWVQRTLGRRGFLAVYLLSALAGNLASLLRPGGTLSVGASGALCGLVGAILATVIVPSRSGVPRLVGGRILF